MAPADEQFKPGDLVYHQQHGTALFLGIQEKEHRPYFALEYLGGDKIFVPIGSAHLLEKVPWAGSQRIDRLRKNGPPPPPPRSLILDRTSRAAGGAGIGTPAETANVTPDATGVSSERKDLVDRARRFWISRLIDLSRRNRLLYFQPYKVRTVELTEEQMQRALPLLAGEAVKLSQVFGRQELVHGDADQELFTEIEDAEEIELGALRRLQEIQKRGNEDFEERGLETVYLAYGMATWKPTDQGTAPQAPVLMAPIALEGKVGRMNLIPRGDVEINLVLTHVLEEEFGRDGLGARLEALLAETDEIDPGQRADRIFSELRTAAEGLPGFQISLKAVVANFAFQKLAMVRDLQQWGDRLAGHDIVAALAGDSTAKLDLSRFGEEGDPREIDKKSPEDEFLVLDADSSQQRAVSAVVDGKSGVIIGPPGTGKSQTIANLIGELVARGKRVLFVAEKRAALDVVKSRLTNRGLGELVLDLHGAVSRKQIMAQYSTAMEAVKDAREPGAEELHRDFVSRRDELNRYVTRLHQQRAPAGLSAYDLVGMRLALEAQGAQSDVRWKGQRLAAMTREHVARLADVLRQAANEPELFLRISSSPWTEARLSKGESVAEAQTLVDEVNGRDWPALRQTTEHCLETLNLRAPNTLADHDELVSCLQDVNSFLETYQEQLFTLDLTQLRDALVRGPGGLRAAWASLTNPSYRRAKRQVKASRRIKARGSKLLAEVETAIRLNARWAHLAERDGAPRSYPELKALQMAKHRVDEDLSRLTSYLTIPIVSEPAELVEALLAALGADRSTPPKIPAVRGYEEEIEALGAHEFLVELRKRKLEPSLWIPNLRLAWINSMVDELMLLEPQLAVFNGRVHDQTAGDFRELDQDRLDVAVARVRRAYGVSAILAADQNEDQFLVLRHQANLRTRHLPFRELVRRARSVVTAWKPCWMASPLAVSQVLGGTHEQLFDVVIFDEASQVLPEDAITSVVRGKSVVVAGDSNQLPPTPFFAADRDDDAQPAEEAEGFESILDQMTAFLPQWMLNWHYRSRDERLVAFSNHHIYDDRLITFPSAGGGEIPLEHVLVKQTVPGDIEEESASAEVSKAVELILQHAERKPEMSLGVIALGIRHANRLEAELARARRPRPELDEFFDGHREEKFFIKNLERVQGDERDVIMLSVGYGKDSGGKLPYRFGPLLWSGGHRRLNVAITRARYRMIVISSFSHYDMDPARSDKLGVNLLRLYLQYAASGGHVFADGGPTPVPRNEFEIQVQESLERVGLKVLPQFGASRYRIDLVVQHPEQLGRYLLAIECDGASYHSQPTARDRDRLRQEHLEARGWRFIRVWSTDWFTRRDAEIGRILEAYRRGLSRSAESGLDDPPEFRDGSSGESASGPVDRARGPRPRILPNLPIDEYWDRQLIELAKWIESDGRLRTEEEMLAEMMEGLGFDRRGRRIEARLRDVIRNSRRRARN